MTESKETAFQEWYENLQTIDEFFALLYPKDNKEGNKEESNKNKKLKVGLKNDY